MLAKRKEATSACGSDVLTMEIISGGVRLMGAVVHAGAPAAASVAWGSAGWFIAADRDVSIEMERLKDELWRAACSGILSRWGGLSVGERVNSAESISLSQRSKNSVTVSTSEDLCRKLYLEEFQVEILG